MGSNATYVEFLVVVQYTAWETNCDNSHGTVLHYFCLHDGDISESVCTELSSSLMMHDTVFYDRTIS